MTESSNLIESRLQWDDFTIQTVWDEVEQMPSYPSMKRDLFGRFMKREDYDKSSTPFAWNISLITPESLGGTLEKANLTALSKESVKFKGDRSLNAALLEWSDLISEISQYVLSPLGRIELGSILRGCDYYKGTHDEKGVMICATPQGKEELLKENRDWKHFSFTPLNIRETWELLSVNQGDHKRHLYLLLD